MAREIEGISIAETVMGRWAPSALVSIERLEFGASPEAGPSIKLVALFQTRNRYSWPEFDKPMHRITMVFDNVRGLRLDDFEGNGVQVMGFDIHSIGDRGWEDLNFEVEDYEDGRIHFFCGRVRIIEANEAAGFDLPPEIRTTSNMKD